MRRAERIAVLTKILTDQPGRLFTLSDFAASLGAAKSTISEDLALIKEVLSSQELGEIESLPGAAGGVRYRPSWSSRRIEEFLTRLVQSLESAQRILPGGFLFMTDVICDPDLALSTGEIFASLLGDKGADHVVTVATKGIPLALAAARALGLPLVIIRDDSKVTEGSSVSLNYVSGSSQKIRTMSLSRRSLQEGARVLFIDDFMKAGGTARGVRSLVEEFGAQLVGTGVLVETALPEEKLIEDYLALLLLEEVDEKSGLVKMRISPQLKRLL
ncbi:MAG: pur operon repressor [Clostridia bacterium]|jgi:purine operon repressor|nr:pur operon repressor [Clostridia bacterium]